MSRRPAEITQDDVKRVIRAAMAAGATTVEIRLKSARVLVRWDEPAPEPAPLAAEDEDAL